MGYRLEITVFTGIDILKYYYAMIGVRYHPKRDVGTKERVHEFAFSGAEVLCKYRRIK